jgi:hypothetical protein
VAIAKNAVDVRIMRVFGFVSSLIINAKLV